jgi:hypothetical protein
MLVYRRKKRFNKHLILIRLQNILYRLIDWCLMPTLAVFVNLVGVGFELTLVVIGTDCIDSYKSNYHTITTTTSPHNHFNLHLILFFLKTVI